MLAELGWTDEHVRLYCEVTYNRVPLTISNHRPHSADRERVLDPENFRELYERQGQPLRAIATLAGCRIATLRTLAELDGLTVHTREPDLGDGLLASDRTWLEREYVLRHRSITDLAAERGVSWDYMAALAARALNYDGNASTFRGRIRNIERAAGFQIFDRQETPITPTPRGRELLHEARLVLQALDQPAAKRRVRRTDDQ